MAIKRREFLQGVGATLLLSRTAAGAQAPNPSAEDTAGGAPSLPAGAKRPNILLLQVDQMQWGAINHRTICNTPNINRLVREGMLFERAYTACSICCPSRAMLNTGSYHWYNGIFNQVHSSPSMNPDMFPDVVLFAQRLKAAGYRNGFVGKWDVSFRRSPLDFGYDTIAAPLTYGRSTLKGVDANPDHVPISPIPEAFHEGHGLVNPKNFNWPGTTEPFLMWAASKIRTEDSNAFYNAECGIRMMKRLALQPGPWHMQIQFVQPHDPYTPLQQYLVKYDPADIPVPRSFHDTFAGKPDLHRREAGTWGDCTEDDYRQGRAHYYAFCEEVDAQIGRVLQALDETGQRDSTLVAFTTDHGDMVGAHHMWSKDWMPYEETYKVPLVLRYPGRINPGTVTSKLVHVHDLAYTFIDAAFAEPLKYRHGRSLLPLADDPQRADWPDHILNVWYGGEFVRGLHMVVTDRYKFVFNSFAWDELYDLRDDPEEMHNAIQDPSYAEVVDDLRARLYELMQEMADPYGDPTTFVRPDIGGDGGDRYCAPRYLPRGRRMQAV
jgi:arylsulfatase A-like enzyme